MFLILSLSKDAQTGMPPPHAVSASSESWVETLPAS
jgi:hypothetical protein